MKTKDRILHKALELFNAHGIAATSSRTISEAIGISYGNLCYHFPQKNDLIYHLYLNMQQEQDEQFVILKSEIMSFDFMARSLRMLLEVANKYRFIFLDNTFIVRNLSKIRAHATRQYHNRRRLLEEIVEFLIEKGYMRADKVQGHNDRIIRSMLIILNSWITDAEIFFEGKEEDKIEYYLELLYAVVRPSLTKEGLRAFDRVYGGEARVESREPGTRNIEQGFKNKEVKKRDA